MTRYSVTLTLKPTTMLDRIWHRRIRETCPIATSMDSGKLARLVPYRFRSFHHAFAASGGYFWLPCPLCDEPFGGHESGQLIPDPTYGPNVFTGICSRCSRARGWVAS